MHLGDEMGTISMFRSAKILRLEVPDKRLEEARNASS